MAKKLLVFGMAAVVAAAPVFMACNSKKQTGAKTYADYINTNVRIGVETGDNFGAVAKDIFKAKEITSYTKVADMLESLKMGKVDALLLSDGFSRQLKESGKYPDFDYFVIPDTVYVHKAGPIFHKAELRDKYNEWFATIVADGTWQQIVDRWIGVPLPRHEDIPRFKFTKKKGTLKMCDTGNYPPLTYHDSNGTIVGFNMDMMSRFAQYMEMDLKVELMDYEAIAAYVTSGEADMSSCTLAITDERKDGLIFGEPSTITQAVLIVAQN